MTGRGLWRWVDRIDRASDARFAAVCGTLVVLVTLADWFSGAEVAASQLYLVPISLAGWCRGRRIALLCALVSAGVWLGIGLGTHDDVATPLEVINATVLFTTYALFGQLVAQVRRMLRREHQLATTDPLTGLHNRRAFWHAAQRELERCRRYGEPFSVAYLDVDGFKGVNDRFGHTRGDELLVQIAAALPQDLRQLDMVARLGGDEFVLLLPDTGVFGASAVVTRLLERLRRAPWRRELGIDFSVGCLTVLAAPDDVEALVARADALMYAMKRGGRGQLRHEVLRDDGAVAAAAATGAAAVARPAPRRAE